MAHVLPKPKLEIHNDILVINDSEIGTKLRMAMEMVGNSYCQTFNFATSPFGASPLAMAEACQKLDRKLNLFYPYVPLDEYTPQMKRAGEMGAKLHIVPDDNFAFVAGTAQNMGGKFISFDSEEAIEVVAHTAQSLNLNPLHVWAAGGLGGITRGLQKAWTHAHHHTVAVIKLEQANYGSAEVIYTKTPFNEAAKIQPPFQCNPYFEAKAWEILRERRLEQGNIAFWNPAAK